ncbi:MAG: two-component system response regulator [Opitutales bacterium]
MRPKILAVDDAKAVRLLAERALRPFACDVSEATNGYNALFAMEKALPDLVLLDVSMPIMGGLELLELMRSNDTLKALPVIMLTSPADHPVMPKISALGVAGTLLKPFNEAALLEKVRSVLTLKPAKAL